MKNKYVKGQSREKGTMPLNRTPLGPRLPGRTEAGLERPMRWSTLQVSREPWGQVANRRSWALVKERGGAMVQKGHPADREECFTEPATLFSSFALTMHAPCKALCPEAQGEMEYLSRGR